MFQQPPPPATSIKPADHVGSLVLVEAQRFQADVPMPSGETVDGVEVDWTPLDGPKAGQTEHGMVFSRVLVGSLRSAVGGDPVLGRVGQGIANPGKTAPWVLQPYTDADAAVATAWINSRPKFQGAANPTASPAAATSASPPANSAPAGGNGGQVDLSTLPPEIAAALAALRQ